jgi:ankyrin repeat protein
MFSSLFGGEKKRNTELIEASVKGDVEKVRQLLSKGADVNFIDLESSENSLNLAVNSLHFSVVDLLLASKADVNYQSKVGYTALYIAGMHGDQALPIVEQLLNAGANVTLGPGPTHGDATGSTPLYVAAFYGGNKIVKRLIDGGAPIDFKLADGSTLMHALAHKCNNATIMMIKKSGIAHDVPRNDGFTPLRVAVIAGNEPAVKALLELDANINTLDNKGITPLLSAVLNDQETMVKLLLANGADTSVTVIFENILLNALNAAVMKGSEKIVQLLVDAGTPVDVKLQGSQTPIKLAEESGLDEIVTILKKALRSQKAAANPVNPDAKTDKLWKELIKPLTEFQYEEIKSLSKSKVFSQLSIDNQLLVCSALCDTNRVKDLITQGANPNHQFKEVNGGMNSLFAATVGYERLFLAQKGKIKSDDAQNAASAQLDTVQCLLEANCDANLQSNDGTTCLMSVIPFNKHYSVLPLMKLLLVNGANPNLRSLHDITPLILAAMQNDQAVVDVLLEAGADINSITSTGCIGAFGYAVDKNNMDLALHLLKKGAKPEYGSVETLPLAVAEWGSLELIKAIEANAGEVVPNEMRGRIAFVAARNTDYEVLEYLLNHGADIKHDNDFGYTPLILASLTNHLELVKRYIERGDDLNTQDVDHETALSLAIEKEYPAIVALLRENDAQVIDYSELSEEGSMLQAAKDGALGSILNLHDAGLSINIKDADGNTPLMLAAKAGHVGLVRSLYHLGAGINHKNNAGESACNLAKRDGQESVLKTLLEFGAEGAVYEVFGFETRDEDEDEPRGTIDAIDMMIGRYSHPYKQSLPYDKDSEEDAADNGDDTSTEYHELDETVSVKLDQFEELLLKPHIIERLPESDREQMLEDINKIRLAGADDDPELLENMLRCLDVFSSWPEQVEEQLPAFEAAADGDLRRLKQLFKSGVDVNITTDDGTTLLMTAAQNGHNNIVTELLKLGVDPNQYRDDTSTALLIACYLGFEDIVKNLLTQGADINTGHVIGSSQGATGNQTGLTVSAAQGNVSLCKLLVRLGANINVVSDSGYTPLMWSLANGASEEVAEFLLKSGANPDPDAESKVPFSTSKTPLTLASENGMESIVKLLLRNKVRIDKQDGDGWTALKRAANSGYVDIVAILLKAGASVDIPDNEGWTALMNAAGHGYLDICKMLLKAGADANVTADSGKTALAQAIGAHNDKSALSSLQQLRQLLGGDDEDNDDTEEDDNSLELIKLLLTKGANPNVAQDGASSLLDEAQENDDTDLVKLLKKHGALPNQEIDEVESSTNAIEDEEEVLEIDEQSEELIDTVLESSTEELSELIKAGASLSYVNANGSNALTTAMCGLGVDFLSRLARRNLREKVDYFLSQHPDFNVPRCDPTPLGLAAYLGDLYFVKYMLKQGAQLETPLLGMGTPLIAALAQGKEACALALIEAGADVQTKTSSGLSVLHVAAEKNLLTMVKVALDKDCSVNNVDQFGFTPLMSAARSGNSAIVSYLLNCGADASIKNSEGLTASDYANQNGHKDIVEMMSQ